jgi:hypothetical protein
MKTDHLVSWVLIISTFLIGGKALGLIDITWTIAFAPVATLMIVSLVIFVISFIFMYKAITKKINEDGDRTQE